MTLADIIDSPPSGCMGCGEDSALDFDFSMAFQPIVSAKTGLTFAHEALVRGTNGEPAGTVFQYVNDRTRYRFDQTCRVKAIQLAAQLGMDCYLSINFMPNAVYQAASCIRTTLKAAERFNFPVDRILFEVTEGEQVDDIAHLQSIMQHYQQTGFLTAIDDFGAGYAGLNLFADLQTDFIKLDMALIRDIHRSHSRQAIVRGILQVCRDLSIRVIAEGVETREEFVVLRDFGIELFQGYYFAKPAFESLALIPAAAFA